MQVIYMIYADVPLSYLPNHTNQAQKLLLINCYYLRQHVNSIFKIPMQLYSAMTMTKGSNLCSAFEPLSKPSFCAVIFFTCT